MNVAFAAEVAPAASAGAPIVAQLLPFAIVIVFFYFLLIRPQQIQQKKRNELLSNLKRGDKVLTVGGLHAEIVAIRDDVLTVSLADGVEVKMSRGGVNSVISKA